MKDAEIWLNSIDIVMRRAWENKKKNLPKHAPQPERKALDDEIWNDIITTIETSARHSCREAFADNRFYKALPPRLQTELIAVCLENVELKFKTFFEGSEYDAPRPLVNRILS